MTDDDETKQHRKDRELRNTLIQFLAVLAAIAVIVAVFAFRDSAF